MKISYNKLKEYIALEETPEEVEKLLTGCGLEVESIEVFETIKGSLKGVVVGEVITCEQHPNADRLRKTTVNVGGTELLSIVCGAPNVAAGQKVLVATIGTTLYTSIGDALKIEKSKIRGEVSEGMICAEDELGLGASHAGIIVLPDSTEVGTPAAELYDIKTDAIFEIGLTANRGDAASHIGVARDLSALLNRALIAQTYTENKSDLAPFKVIVEQEIDCPRYAGVLIENIAVKESPTWLKNILKSIGLNPINNVVDATNYI
ncbi:MAG: phenylalanine--tRNA ligase subunit beta, partial [Bacteroidetes bacterium]|nr:phenylalanine--tRNA ligase subunit beta [Bacteroidota bacterium]